MIHLEMVAILQISLQPAGKIGLAVRGDDNAKRKSAN